MDHALFGLHSSHPQASFGEVAMQMSRSGVAWLTRASAGQAGRARASLFTAESAVAAVRERERDDRGQRNETSRGNDRNDGGVVREFRRDDIAQAVELHSRVFGANPAFSAAGLG